MYKYMYLRDLYSQQSRREEKLRVVNVTTKRHYATDCDVVTLSHKAQ